MKGYPGTVGRLDKRNSPATPTPVIHGKYVYAHFGTAGMMCCDLQGKLVWTNTSLPSESVYGVGASPTIGDDILVVVNNMPDGQGSPNVCALDCATGTLRWSQPLPATAGPSGISRTPLIKLINGEKLILVWGRDYLRAYNLYSGREAWVYSFTARGVDLVASMVSDQTSLYLSDRAGTIALSQAKLGSNEDPLLWKNTKPGPNCSSPVVTRGLLFYVTDAGIAHCLDSQTGKLVWRERLQGNYYASMIADGERVYFTNSEGLTTVVEIAREFRQLAENGLAESIFASFAPVDGELFIRTTENVYCITNNP